MQWILRNAALSDRARIKALFDEMLLTISPEAEIRSAESDWDYYFAGEDKICVAEADGQVVGFLSMEVHREDVEYIYLDDLSVSAAYRGQGIGASLLSAADDFAREKGISVIVLHVKISNPRAKALYERMGYTVLDDDGDRYRMIKKTA